MNVVDPFCGGHSSSSGGVNSAGANNHQWLNPCMPQGGGLPMCHHSGPGPPGALPPHTHQSMSGAGGPLPAMGLGEYKLSTFFVSIYSLVLKFLSQRWLVQNLF